MKTGFPVSLCFRILVLGTLAFLCSFTKGMASSSRSTDYSIAHQTLGSGGGRSASVAYEFESTIGPPAGTSQSPGAIYNVQWGNAAQINRPPVIGESIFALPENASLEFVLDASDKEADNLSYQILQEPEHGTLEGNPPDLTYTPELDFFGTDQFVVVASDGLLQSLPATIELQVISREHSPVAQGLSVSLNEDENSGPFELKGTDPNGDALTFQITQGPSFGTLSGEPPNLTYQPNSDFFGQDSFRFRVNDGVLVSADATVLLNVIGVNDPPLLISGQLALDEDTEINFNLTARDIDGDPLTYHFESEPLHGELIGTPPFLRYRPNPNFHGQDSFQMRVRDSSLVFSEVATFSISVRPVNDLPIATDQQLTIPEDTPLDLVLQGEDPDGGEIVFTVLEPPQLGSLEGQAPAMRYTPQPNRHGNDSFTFSVSDAEGVTVQATVRIDVTPVNDPPQASDRQLSLLSFDRIELPQLGNDPDQDVLTVEILTPPEHGQLTSSGAVYYYDHDGDGSTIDSFTYRVGDGTDFSPPARVDFDITVAKFTFFSTREIISELDGSTQLVISRSTHLDKDLTFELKANPPDRLILPSTVVLPRGKERIELIVTSEDNLVFDGDANVQLNVVSQGFASRQAVIQVIDNEELRLTLTSTFLRIAEADGATELKVSLNTPPLDTPRVIQLSNSEPEHLIAPSQVTIPAGATSVKFAANSVDNDVVDGFIEARIGASTDPDLQTQIFIEVLDDDGTHTGTVSDGLIAGALIFFDINENYQLDEGEPYTITNEEGRYWLNLPLEDFDINGDGVLNFQDGRFVTQGGVDISTGAPQRTPLFSSPTAAVVTPLTTLVVALLENDDSLQESEAAFLVRESLGIGGGIDLLQFDTFEETKSGNPIAVDLAHATSNVQDTILKASSFLSGVSQGSAAEHAGQIQQALVDRILNGQPMELQDVGFIQDILREVSEDLTVSEEVLRLVGDTISAGNRLKRELALNADDPQDAVREIARVQTFIHEELRLELHQLGAQNHDLDEFLLKYEGQGFWQQVQSVGVGVTSALDSRPGTFSFGQPEYLVQEDGKTRVSIRIIRSEGVLGEVDLEVIPSLISASNADFRPTPIPVHFDSFEINQTVPMGEILIDDQVIEENEHIQLALRVSGPENSEALIGAQGQTIVEIADNDRPGIFQFTSSSLVVREPDQERRQIFIERTHGATGEVSLNLEIVDVETTAQHGTDFILGQTEVIFPHGVLARKITIQILDDEHVESNERIGIRLLPHPTNGNGATLGERSLFTITILNDDLSLPPTIDLPGDQQTEEDFPLGPIFFGIDDDLTPVSDLQVSVESSNAFLIPEDAIIIEETQDPAVWSLTANPAANAFGETVITIHVSDGTLTTSASFNLLVSEQNDLPLILGIPQVVHVRDEPVVVELELRDVETSPEDLFVYFTGQLEGINIANFIEISGSGALRRMTIRRPPGLDHEVPMQLFVLDSGGLGYGEGFRIIFGDPAPEIPPIVAEIINGASIRLTWEGDFQLYTTGNLSQPFDLLPEAVSPFEVALEQMGFYLLRPNNAPPEQAP